MATSVFEERIFRQEGIADFKRCRPTGRRPHFRLARVLAFLPALIAGLQSASAQDLSSNYVWVGAQQVQVSGTTVSIFKLPTTSGIVLPSLVGTGGAPGGGTPGSPVPGDTTITTTYTGSSYSYNQVGDFTNGSLWGGSGGTQDDQYVANNTSMNGIPTDNPSSFETASPGASDSIFVIGQPSGDKPGGQYPSYTDEINGGDSAYEGTTSTTNSAVTYGNASLGYTGGAGFVLTNVSGTVANLSVTGPGTMTLAGLTVNGVTALDSIGGIGLLQLTGSGPASTTFGQDDLELPVTNATVSSYAPSALTVNGGSLTTPVLMLAAGTNLGPNYSSVLGTTVTSLGVVIYTASQSGAPDPVADVGSLTISGATLTGTITQLTGLPSNTVNYLPSSTSYGTYAPGTDPNTLQLYSQEEIAVAPVMLTNGAKLNAPTELDIIGVDPTLYPNATGTTKLVLNASTITSPLVVIATGATGYGSGNKGVAAELDLTSNSTLTATNGSLFVGDTGNGTLMVSGGSTITDQQAILANATGSTGTATIDGSTWTNAGYLSVGNQGVGMLTIKNGAQVTTTGQYGNIFIAGLAGSAGSQVTVTGSGSLLQSSGYFTIGEDGTGDGTGTLTVEDQAKVVTGDVMYVGEVQGANGTVNISGGATVTNNTTGTYGTSSTVLGVVAGSYGSLSIDGSGSKLESTGDMSVGYSGDGNATITNGGSLVVDGTLFRVGRNEGSNGTLTVTGAGSSVTASNATIYIGFGGTGTVTVESGASMTVMGTDIGGQSTGDGELDIDGQGTQANLGNVTVGDAGAGTLNVTDGASVTTGTITIGAQNADPIFQIGDNAQVMANGAMIIGNQGAGNFIATENSMLTVNSMMVGNGAEAFGVVGVHTGSQITVTGDMSVAVEGGSEGNVTVDGTGSIIRVNGDLTIGEGGTADVMMTTGSRMNVTGDLNIGENAGSDGTLTIDGAMTNFIFGAGEVTVGNEGTGTLIVQNSANVDFTGNSVTLGGELGGDGALLVTDQGTMMATGDLTVGGGGSGTLIVQDGAQLSSDSVTIGDEQFSNGTATVDGAGSSWASNNLTVGGSGSGTLNIENGGTVIENGTTLTIGDDVTGDGIVTISGKGSELNFQGQMNVAEHGIGLLAVQGGGSFTAHAVNVGDQSDGIGTINVDGNGTTMEVQTDFNIGEQGSGTLNVTNSAKLIADTNAAIADMPGSIGTANIGTFGSWSVGGTLTVGGQGSAHMTISGGGTVSASNITLGDQVLGTGTVYVNGTPGLVATLQFSNNLIIGNAGTGALNINAGGQVTNNNPTAGSTVEVGVTQTVGTSITTVGTGYVDVMGAGASFQVRTLFDGDGGEGNVGVGQGATLTAQTTVVGVLPNGVGTLLATDPNTSVQLGSTTIGLLGTGSLDVEAGANVTTTSLQLALTYNPNLPLGTRQASVSVEGTDGNDGLLSSGPIVVGEDGTAQISVMYGGKVTATSMELGVNPGSLGRLTVDGLNGSGSSVTVSGDLLIGLAGTGQVALNNGAKLTDQNVVVDGVTVVNDGYNVDLGNDSIWNTLGNMTIAVTGTLRVSATDGSVITVGGNLTLGQNQNSRGVLLLQDPSVEGTTFNQTGGVTTIGQSGTGLLTILPAASANLKSSLVTLGLNPTGNGSIYVGNNLGGLGATLDLNQVVVGDAGTGFVDVANGGTMVSHAALMTIGNQAGSTGTVTVEGPMSDLILNSGATVMVGLSGTGTFNVTNTASFSVSNMILGETAATGNGTANVTGTGASGTAKLYYGNLLDVADSGSGNLNVTAGGLVAPSPNGMGLMVVATQPGSTGTVAIDGGNSQLQATLLVVGGAGGTGTVNLTNDANAYVATLVNLGANGSINVAGGASTSSTTGVTANNVTVEPDGIIGTPNTGGGLTIGSNATTAVPGDVLVNVGGTLEGTGSIIGNVVNNGGTVMAGDDPGMLTINGNFTQGPTGVLDIEVAGTTPGSPTGYSVLNVTGNATIGGTIQLSFLNGFKPTAGQTYNYLTVAGTTTGAFSGVTVTGLLTDDVTDSFTGSTVTINSVTRDFASPALIVQLSPNQQAVGASLNSVVNGATGDLNTLLTSINNLTMAQQIGQAYDQLSPQRLELFRNIAFDNFAFSSQQLDDHLANLRDGMTGLDTTGFAFSDSALGSSLSQIKGHLLAWQPAPTPGLLSDTANPVLGGVSMSNASLSENQRWSAFINGDVVLADLDSNPDVSHSNYTTGGVTMGADYRLDRHWTVGALFA